jgi:hypothetical protein
MSLIPKLFKLLGAAVSLESRQGNDISDKLLERVEIKLHQAVIINTALTRLLLQTARFYIHVHNG